MRDTITTTNGSTYTMIQATVTADDASLTPALQTQLKAGIAKPWNEWRVICTRANGASKIDFVSESESECDAAMDNIRAQEDARRALEAEDGA